MLESDKNSMGKEYYRHEISPMKIGTKKFNEMLANYNNILKNGM